jgi:DMSO/TMAO reductase YedYZ molybdopterin-dependent catalytic subunit
MAVEPTHATKIARRDFLRTTLFTGAALAVGCSELWPSPLQAQALVPGKETMIVRSLRYFDLEMPTDQLRSWVTPTPLFFVRNHMAEPYALDLEAWRLRVTGEVERPLTLGYTELSKMAQASVVNTLECAGNGRGFFQPHVPGVQWQRGAVGNARWSGIPLHALLEQARLTKTARHVAFLGLDEPPSKVPQFIRSIPIEKAMHPDTLVATHMNGARLLKHHGFPARALVPGWVGAASVKWLAEIRVLDSEFVGNFMKPGYRLPRSPVHSAEELKSVETYPLTALNVKSIIARPVDGSSIKLGPAGLSGAAWAGENEVQQVEVSTDGGRSWDPAALGRDHARYAWRLWSFAWQPKSPGEYVLMSRATDSAGRTQPATAFWNPSGYLWNAVDQVKVRVEA